MSSAKSMAEFDGRTEGRSFMKAEKRLGLVHVHGALRNPSGRETKRGIYSFSTRLG